MENNAGAPGSARATTDYSSSSFKYRALGRSVNRVLCRLRARPRGPIAARSHGCDVHSAPTHVVERVPRGREATPGLCKSGSTPTTSMTPMCSLKAFRVTVTNPTGLPSTTATKASRSSPATRSHLLGLRFLPVGLQAREDGVAENVSQRGVDRIPCAKRELHDCVEVALLELSYLDCVSHRRDKTLPEASTISTAGSARHGSATVKDSNLRPWD